MTVSAKEIKQLRDATGAPMMECKKALEESQGNQTVRPPPNETISTVTRVGL